MKVAILTPTFSKFSGIDRVVELQARELIHEGDEVTVFALEADMKDKNLNLEIVGMPKGIFFQRIYRLILPLDLPKTVKMSSKLKEFDLIISHQYPMNWFAFITKKFHNVKYTYYNHGVSYSNTFSNPFEKLYLFFFKCMTRVTVQNVDSAISVSDFLRKEFKKETGIESIVVYNKIDTERFHKGVKGMGIRKKYNLKKDPTILYVGRISPHKGVHLLIEAFNSVKKEVLSAKLLIVGKHTFGGYSDKLKNMSDKSVIFAGYVSDDELPYYYAACNVYATASLWEGFDLPVVEAQACGKPVVAFNNCSHPEVVKIGRLVEENNIKEFIDALKMYTQPNTRLPR